MTGAPTLSSKEEREEFAKHFDALLSMSTAATVMYLVADEMHKALAHAGFVLGKWAPNPNTQQTFEVQQIQWAVPFQDSASGLGFHAFVRLFVVHTGWFNRGSMWVDLVRDGEERNDPESVSQSVLDKTWPGLSQEDAYNALNEQLIEWSLPESARDIQQRACELVADLTSIFAP